MNFITAIIFSLIYCAIIKFAGIAFTLTNVGTIVIAIILSIVTMNIGLGVFNLLPLPPLDGSKIFLPILPRNAKTWFINNQQIFYIIFLIIWITGIAGTIISPVINVVFNGIFKLAKIIFKI